MSISKFDVLEAITTISAQREASLQSSTATHNAIWPKNNAPMLALGGCQIRINLKKQVQTLWIPSKMSLFYYRCSHVVWWSIYIIFHRILATKCNFLGSNTCAAISFVSMFLLLTFIALSLSTIHSWKSSPIPKKINSPFQIYNKDHVLIPHRR